MVVIGGLGSLPGALLGATYVHCGRLLPAARVAVPGHRRRRCCSCCSCSPAGFGGVLADLRDGVLRKVATRRGIVVPSLLADVRVEEVADAPPEETVLAEAAEIAELAEAEEADEVGRWRRTRPGRPHRRPAGRRRRGPVERRAGERGRPRRTSPSPPTVTARSRRCGRDHATTRRARRGAPAAERGRRRPTPRPSPRPSDAAEGLLDGAAAVDAIGIGDVGEDAAEVVRRAVGPVGGRAPRTADGATGGVVGALEAAHHQRRARSSRWPCCSASTWSTSSTAPPSACCCPRSATTSASTPAASSPSSSLSLMAALLLALPIGFYADRWQPGADRRRRRHRLGRLLGADRPGAAASGCWASPGPAPAWAGRSTTRSTTRCWPTTTTSRPGPQVYAVHRYANALGQFLGPLSAGLHRLRLRLAGAVLRLRRRHRRLRGAHVPAARADPRPASSARPWARREEVADTEEEAAVVGRVVAHRLAGPQPAPHLYWRCRSSPSPSSACSR